MSSLGLLPDDPPPAGSVFAARVSRADPTMVTLDAYGSTYAWPATWLGATPPFRGMRAVAVRDDQGGLFALSAAAPSAINVKAYGAVGDGITDDTAAIQAAVDAAESQFRTVGFPAGTYRTSATIRSRRPVSLIGEASRAVLIRTTARVDLLHIGDITANGGSDFGPFPNCRIENLELHHDLAGHLGGDTHRALVLEGVPNATVKNVSAFGYSDVAYDLVNNCYGASFENVRAWPVNGALVALRLREGPQSGNDLCFDNCWLGGRDAAVWCDPGFGGAHFNGGQLNAGMVGSGLAAADDDLGVIVAGKNRDTDALGEVGNIDFNGVDFEPVQRTWGLRFYSTVQCSVRDSSFLANGANAAIGVIKATDVGASRLHLANNRVRGTWAPAADTMCSLAGHDSVGHMEEFGTDLNAVIDGSGTSGVNLTSLALSQTAQFAVNRRLGYTSVILDGKHLRNNAGVIEEATGHAGTWTPLVNPSDGALVSIPDDTVAYFPEFEPFGLYIVHQDSTADLAARYALLVLSGTSAPVVIAQGANVTVGSVVLTDGAGDGVDGHLNIFPKASGLAVGIKNRLGGTATFSFRALLRT